MVGATGIQCPPIGCPDKQADAHCAPERSEPTGDDTAVSDEKSGSGVLKK